MTAQTLYKIGSVTMMIIGTGHNVIHLAHRGKNPQAALVIDQMRQFKVAIGGFGSRSMLEFHEGFSLTMGALLFFVGLQNLVLLSTLKAISHHSRVVLLSVIISLTVFLLSLKYFIIIPQALSLIAMIAFSLSYWMLKKRE